MAAAKRADTDALTPEEAGVQIADRHFALIDRALALQAPLANKYIDGIRRKNPDLSDDEVVRRIEKQFLTLATATGAGVGGTAALPGVGTALAVGLTAGEGAAFAEACAFLALSVARVRGVDMTDPERRRMVTLGIIGGERGSEIVAKALGKQGAQWSTVLDGIAPDFVMAQVNKRVKKWIQRRAATRLGGVWLGRLAPFGLGAAIGGFGNRAVAKGVIDASREIFSHAHTTTIEGAKKDERPSP